MGQKCLRSEHFRRDKRITLKLEYARFVIRKWVDGKQDSWMYLLCDLWRTANIIMVPVGNSIESQSLIVPVLSLQAMLA
jgi:hypothetical protein